VGGGYSDAGTFCLRSVDDLDHCLEKGINQMADNTGGVMASAKKLSALGLGTFAVTAAFMSLGSAVASADVEEVAPTPQVTSRQALVIDENALRATAIGEARGLGESRAADMQEVTAQGEVRDSTKAVVGTTAAPFNLEDNGSFAFSPPIGDW
jgi:hypothetical protein